MPPPPPDPARPQTPARQRIVAAGRKLFFAHGFAAVSTDMLAREARLSKATLYQHFDNLSDLLVEVLTTEGQRIGEREVPRCETWPEFRDAVVAYGAGLLRFLNDPEVIRFSQLIHEEARRHPEVAERFYRAAYGASQRLITAMIRRGVDAGYLVGVGKPAEAAEQLLGMWTSRRWTRAIMGLSRRPFPRPEAWARRCVAVLFGPDGRRDVGPT